MDVIPVIDLKGGLVVHAQRGQRHRYAPIRTPLSATADPVAVAHAVMALHPFPRLYVADLDAIGGAPAQRAALAGIARALPAVELWVDAGPRTLELCAALPRARPVAGSEWLPDLGAWERLRLDSGDTAVLSLDFIGARLRGPPTLARDPTLWPRDVIVMALDRVGSGLGPAHERLAAVARAAPACRVYAAGGVRDARDLQTCRLAGAAGALVASALHRGAIDGAVLTPAVPRGRKNAAPP